MNQNVNQTCQSNVVSFDQMKRNGSCPPGFSQPILTTPVIVGNRQYACPPGFGFVRIRQAMPQAEMQHQTFTPPFPPTFHVNGQFGVMQTKVQRGEIPAPNPENTCANFSEFQQKCGNYMKHFVSPQRPQTQPVKPESPKSPTPPPPQAEPEEKEEEMKEEKKETTTLPFKSPWAVKPKSSKEEEAEARKTPKRKTSKKKKQNEVKKETNVSKVAKLIKEKQEQKKQNPKRQTKQEKRQKQVKKDRSTEWFCNNCEKGNWLGRARCRECDAEKPENPRTQEVAKKPNKPRKVTERRFTEWVCEGCNKGNWLRKQVCRVCAKPKPENPTTRIKDEYWAKAGLSKPEQPQKAKQDRKTGGKKQTQNGPGKQTGKKQTQKKKPEGKTKPTVMKTAPKPEKHCSDNPFDALVGDGK